MKAVKSGGPRFGTNPFGSAVSKDKFEIVPLPVPTAAEQRAIAAVLSDVDELIGSLEALIAKKQTIKQGMMQQLLSGSIRLPIPDAVPGDELSR